MEESGSRKPRVRDLNAHLICVLCGGYYVDATTIVECLHSFCRSCIVRHLETSRFCPICDVQVHKAKPLHSIRADRTLQTLAYKLVPGLYQAEMQRQREFNAGSSSELQLDPSFFSPEDSISLSLEYYDSDNADDEEDGENSKESELEKNKQMPHRRYLQCPAAVSMKHLKKFIRMKYGLSCQHRVDIIYAGECLKDDFSLMDVAYTFAWKRVAPMRFSYRIFHPPVYVPAPTPPKVPDTIQTRELDQPNLDTQQESEDRLQSPSTVVPPTENVYTAENKVVEAVSQPMDTAEAKDSSEKCAASPEAALPDDEVKEPPAKKVKLSLVLNDDDCKNNLCSSDTELGPKKKEQEVLPVPEVKEKRQKKRRKKSSSIEVERKSVSRETEQLAETRAVETTPAVAEETADVTTAGETTATNDAATPPPDDVNTTSPPCDSPRSEETDARKEEEVVAAEEAENKVSSDDSTEKQTEAVSNEVVEPSTTQEEGNACVEDNNVAETGGNGEVVDEESVEDSERVSGEGEAEGEILDHDDKEDDFTLRLSSSEEEEAAVETVEAVEDVKLTTKLVTKQPDDKEKEEKHVKDVEERKKLKGKRDGRKKSKHKSKHHHQESSTRKRKAHRSESTPTILQYQEDVMKLKVKLGPIKPVLPHRHHHHHHHSKHNRKLQQEAESSSNAVALRSNGESSGASNSATSAKERLLQMRAVRHKNISTSKSASPPGKDDAGRAKKTEVLMPPSSITVSKVSIAEKRKLDTQKAAGSGGQAGDESKRPSLEIMLVNAPAATTAAATTGSTTITATTTASNSAESQRGDTAGSSRDHEHGFKPTRPPPPTIPLVRIKKTSVTTIRPPSGLTITPKMPTTSTTTPLPTKSTTTISKTPIVSKLMAAESSGQKDEAEEETTMRHDDIGALDLSGKSSRCKSTSSPVTSPLVAPGFPSPPSPVLKSPVPTASSTHQSILSIAQSLVHRQLQQQQQHGLKAAKAHSGDSVGGHPPVVASPVYAMSNLKTLSDTAVRIRNEMAAQGDKRGSPVKPQKPVPLSVQMSAAPDAATAAAILGRASMSAAYAPPSTPRTLPQSPSRSPAGYQGLGNNSIPPLRIPIPPTTLSKTGGPPAAVPRLHELYPSTTQGALGRGRGMVPNRGAVNHTKPGPNQAVRHIPNPSALLFRQQQTQNRLQQQQQQQQGGRHAAVGKALFGAQNSFNNAGVKPGSSIATPVSSIRKMENMTRNIEKVAAGLTVRAVEAHSK